MSVRAYREITPPVLDTAPTFSVSAEEDLFDALALLDDSWTSEAYDRLEIRIVKLDEFLDSDEAKAFMPEAIAELKKDAAIVKGTGEEYITYHCF